MNMDTDLHCRLLTLADTEQAAQVLSWAFFEDPLIIYMLPTTRSRQKTLHTFFRAYGELSIKGMRGYWVGDPLQGVAFWKTPQHADLSINLKSLPRFLPLLFAYYPLGLFRARKVIQATDNLRQKYTRAPHYYLDNLGVVPGAWGKGFSTALIRPFLDKADTDKVTVYTDTVNPVNVPFYEHFGFQCVEQAAIGDTGITVFAFVRQPYK